MVHSSTEINSWTLGTRHSCFCRHSSKTNRCHHLRIRSLRVIWWNFIPRKTWTLSLVVFVECRWSGGRGQFSESHRQAIQFPYSTRQAFPPPPQPSCVLYKPLHPEQTATEHAVPRFVRMNKTTVTLQRLNLRDDRLIGVAVLHALPFQAASLGQCKAPIYRIVTAHTCLLTPHTSLGDSLVLSHTLPDSFSCRISFLAVVLQRPTSDSASCAPYHSDIEAANHRPDIAYDLHAVLNAAYPDPHSRSIAQYCVLGRTRRYCPKKDSSLPLWTKL